MSCARWTPGDVPAAVSQQSVLALDDRNELLERLWMLVEQGKTLADVLRELVLACDGSFMSLPDLMFVLAGPDGVQAVARGRFRLLSATGEVLLHAPAPVAWEEVRLPSAEGLVVELGHCHPDTVAMALRSGVVAASRISLSTTVPAPRDDEPLAVPNAHGQPSVSVAAAAGPEPAPESEALAGDIEPETDLEPGSGAVSSPPGAPEGLGVSNITLGPEHLDLIGADVPAPQEPDAEPAGSYSGYAHHYGDHTMVVPVSEAAIHLGDDNPPPLASTPSQPEPPTGESPTAEAQEAGEPGAAPAEAATSADDWKHDGYTMVGSKLRDGRPLPAAGGAGPSQGQGGQAGADSGGEDTVLAVMCPAQHPNAVVALSCRVCGAEVSGPTVRVPRPVLARLRTSSGEEVSLDKDVIIGRAPLATPHSGGATPHQVAVACLDKAVSKTHCAVWVQGWDLFVEDLGSVNGTFLLRRGQAPRRVARGTLEPLQVGDVLDLADSVSITVEACDA